MVQVNLSLNINLNSTSTITSTQYGCDIKATQSCYMSKISWTTHTSKLVCPKFNHTRSLCIDVSRTCLGLDWIKKNFFGSTLIKFLEFFFIDWQF